MILEPSFEIIISLVIKMIPKKAMPINISTRGDGGDYQQVGILYKDSVIDEEKAPGNNTDANVLPLTVNQLGWQDITIIPLQINTIR